MEKPHASETLLFTFVTVKGGGQADITTFVAPVEEAMVMQKDGLVWLRLPRQTVEEESYGAAFLSYTDDPGPKHAFECGSIGHRRTRFIVDPCNVKKYDGRYWAVGKVEDYKCQNTIPLR